LNSDEEKVGNSGEDGSWARLFNWVDDEGRVRQVVIGLAVFCALLFVIDLFHHRHAYFGFEESRGFYAVSGFFAFALIVLAAGQLRRLIRRPENYYGYRSTNAEPYPEEGLQKLTSTAQQQAVNKPANDGGTSGQQGGMRP